MNQDWFFYLDKGETIGPLSSSDIKGRISKGDLGPLDLVYRDGDEKWIPLHQLTHFSDLFQTQRPIQMEETWVVLYRKDRQGNPQYLQRGPLTQPQVEELLMSGELSFQDFIWKDGDTVWSRIAKRPEFKPKEKIERAPQDLWTDEYIKEDQRSSEEILEEIVPQVRLVQTDEVVPPEAKLPSEDEPQNSKDKTAGYRVPKSLDHPTTQVPLQRSTVPVGPSFDLPAPVEKPFRISLLPIAAVISVFGVGFALYLHKQEILVKLGLQEVGRRAEEEESLKELIPSKKQSAQATKPKAEKTVSKERVEIETSKPTEVIQITNESDVPKIEPTEIKVKVKEGVSGFQGLQVMTNGSHHWPVRGLVIGKAGSVLGSVSVYKDFTLKSLPKQIPFLSQQDLGLQEGLYEVEVSSGQVLAKTRFRVGRQSQEFKSKLEKHRKLIALPFQREKRKLLKAALELSQILQTMKTKNANDQEVSIEIKKWSRARLEGVNLNAPKTLVFPKDWKELAEISTLAMEVSGTPMQWSSLIKRMENQLEDIRDRSLFN